MPPLLFLQVGNVPAQYRNPYTDTIALLPPQERLQILEHLNSMTTVEVGGLDNLTSTYTACQIRCLTLWEGNKDELTYRRGNIPKL